MIEIVYKGRSTTFKKQVLINGEPASFFAVTRMVLIIGGVVVDSDINPEAIRWLLGDGVIEFKLGHLDIPLGLHQCELVVYDSDHPEGQPLAHPAGPKFTVRVVR